MFDGELLLPAGLSNREDERKRGGKLKSHVGQEGLSLKASCSNFTHNFFKSFSLKTVSISIFKKRCTHQLKNSQKIPKGVESKACFLSQTHDCTVCVCPSQESLCTNKHVPSPVFVQMGGATMGFFKGGYLSFNNISQKLLRNITHQTL